PVAGLTDAMAIYGNIGILPVAQTPKPFGGVLDSAEGNSAGRTDCKRAANGAQASQPVGQAGIRACQYKADRQDARRPRSQDGCSPVLTAAGLSESKRDRADRNPIAPAMRAMPPGWRPPRLLRDRLNSVRLRSARRDRPLQSAQRAWPFRC